MCAHVWWLNSGETQRKIIEFISIRLVQNNSSYTLTQYDLISIDLLRVRSRANFASLRISLGENAVFGWVTDWKKKGRHTVPDSPSSLNIHNWKIFAVCNSFSSICSNSFHQFSNSTRFLVEQIPNTQHSVDFRAACIKIRIKAWHKQKKTNNRTVLCIVFYIYSKVWYGIGKVQSCVRVACYQCSQAVKMRVFNNDWNGVEIQQ